MDIGEGLVQFSNGEAREEEFAGIYIMFVASYLIRTLPGQRHCKVDADSFNGFQYRYIFG